MLEPKDDIKVELATMVIALIPWTEGRKEMFYLTTHSTHLVTWRTCVHEIPWQNSYVERKGSVLFNDTLNTFYLRLYGVRHMVKDH